MLGSQLLLSAVTAHPRHSVVPALSTALNDLGWVVGFHQFSNTALAVHFELPVNSLSCLVTTLTALPLHLSSDSLGAIRDFAAKDPSTMPDPLPGSINVTFVHSEPDLRIPVPAVPG